MSNYHEWIASRHVHAHGVFEYFIFYEWQEQLQERYRMFNRVIGKNAMPDRALTNNSMQYPELPRVPESLQIPGI